MQLSLRKSLYGKSLLRDIKGQQEKVIAAVCYCLISEGYTLISDTARDQLRLRLSLRKTHQHLLFIEV